MKKIEVKWGTCQWNVWCSFAELKTNAPLFNNLHGIYCIFQLVPAKYKLYHTIYVGSGIIRNRIKAHRKEPNIKRYKYLLVTWAEIPKQGNREGVERYLADELIPLEGSDYPDVEPIAVNFPYKDARIY